MTIPEDHTMTVRDDRTRNGHHTAVVLERTQRRIQGMLVDHRENKPSRENLTEERDTLSRIKMALRRLRPEHIDTLNKHVDDYTVADCDRITVLLEVLAALLAQPYNGRSIHAASLAPNVSESSNA